MIVLIKKIIRAIKKRFLQNKFKRNFQKKIQIAPQGNNLNENLYAYRFMCHQLEKTIKNELDVNNIRGQEKYDKAKEILIYLEKTEWAKSPDVEWGKKIIQNYRLLAKQWIKLIS